MQDELDRREFGTMAAAVAAAAVLLERGSAEAQPRSGAVARPVRGWLAAPGEKNIVPLPAAAGSLPGLSARMINSHHQNNYAGAVRKLNEIRQQLAGADPAQSGGYWSLYGSLRAAELPARNSAFLHEAYFANLAANQTPPAALAQLLNQRFGSMDRVQAQLRGAAKASNGWVLLVADASSRTLEIVQTDGHAFGAWNAEPLLVLDMFEHAYAIDYGADKNAYFDAFWRNVHWGEVHARTQRAIARS